MTAKDAADQFVAHNCPIGERLQKARLSQNLTVEQVAQRLHLHNRIVEALEHNQFNVHPGITFMRGYLFSYIRFLGLPEEEFGHDFAHLALLDTPEKYMATENFRPPLFHRKPSFIERNLRLVTALVIMIIFLLVAIWWHGHRLDTNRIRDLLSDSHSLFSKTNTTTTPTEPKSNVADINKLPNKVPNGVSVNKLPINISSVNTVDKPHS